MTSPSLEDLENEPLNAERMRRMKSLMRQLYKEEFESKKRHLPPVKGSGIIIFFSIVTIVVFVGTTLYNYNKFVALREQVSASIGHVEATLQRRSNLFNTLVNLALNQAELEREVFRHVANVRQEFTQGGSATPVVEGTRPGEMPQEAASMSGLSRLLAVVEKFPDIKATATYKELMTDLIKIENDIFDRRSEANEAIRVFNTRVTSFPWQYLAALTGFEHMDYYHSIHSKEDNLLLTSSSFTRLLPPGMSGVQPKSAQPSAPSSAPEQQTKP